ELIAWRPPWLSGSSAVTGRSRLDHHSSIFGRDGCAAQRLDEAERRALGHFEIAFGRSDLDRADLVAADVPVPADQRQQPARVRIVTPTGIDPEPGRTFEARTRA